jgi:hypothetical protein
MFDVGLQRDDSGLRPTESTRDMDSEAVVAIPHVESQILLIRGQRVLLDSDLAELYEVPTKALNQAVKRNLSRFPGDFMFRLTQDEGREVEILRSQFVTLRHGQFRKYAPNVFTEHGVAMLSSVLGSERAIVVNIAIIRTFIRLREYLATHQEIAARLEQVEWRQHEQAQEIQHVFETIKQLVDAPDSPEPKRKYGFPVAETSLQLLAHTQPDLAGTNS